MNEIMNIISSPEFGDVRTVLREGEPWFVAKDVCEALGIANSRDAVARLDEDEKGVGISDTLGGKQEVSTVNEFGLYQLILRSNKPEAKRFKRWITHDVLPSIRKQGYYSTIKDEDLVAIISERRKENATYLLAGLAEEREKLNAERYERLKAIWNTRRFDLTLEQVDGMIDEIWHGDVVEAGKAKEHYRELYFSRLGLSKVYGRWKEPKKPKQRVFAREKEIIECYEEAALRKKLAEILAAGGCRAEDCKNRIDFLDRQSETILKQYYEIQSLKAENERLKNMVNAAMD